MKRSIRQLLLAAAFCAAPGMIASAATPQGTSFTYQGRLTDSGAPANGLFDIELRLYDAAAGGNQIGSTVTLNDQSVVNGVFSASLDFGAQYNGDTRWLELRVRPGASVGAYTPIAPRTLLDSTPYAQALRLPLTESGSAQNGLLTLTNTNTTPGSAHVLKLISGASSGNAHGYFYQPVLIADTNDGNGIVSLVSSGGGYGYYGRNEGSGGTSFVGENAASSGGVANFSISVATNTSDALTVHTAGTGSAGEFNIGNATSSANAFESSTVGTGRAGYFTSTKVTATLPTLGATNAATGDSSLGSNTENGVAIKGAATGGFSVGVMGTGVQAGVFGYCGTTGGAGIYGRTGGGGGDISSGVRGDGNGAGTSAVAAFNNLGTAVYAQGNTAGQFVGAVTINGSLNVTGSKNFKIDHPLDPANKFLVHAAVESSEMKNIYDGIITLGADGSATVTMPSYFGALNVEYRYQLTCIGGQAMVYVAEEMNQNHFKIAGGKPGMKVSWQVTGVRNDAGAVSNPLKTEVDKVGFEIGRYMNPEAYGKPASMRIEPMNEPLAGKTPAVN